jgi:hypothetical protein
MCPGFGGLPKPGAVQCVLERTLVSNQRHLMRILREYETFYGATARTVHCAKPRYFDRCRPTSLISNRSGSDDNDRIGGVLHEYKLVA